MARELIKFSNDKKGFRLLLAVEAAVVVWALSATLYAVKAGRTGTMVYGCITLLAAAYIWGRSFRSYRNIIKKEREEKGDKTP